MGASGITVYLLVSACLFAFGLVDLKSLFNPCFRSEALTSGFSLKILSVNSKTGYSLKSFEFPKSRARSKSHLKLAGIRD